MKAGPPVQPAVRHGRSARVVVIGGGIAGVSIAYELAATASVVLLEQEPELSYHTTGRSAAMYLQSYGNAVVRALTVASRVDYERIEADFDTAPLLREQPQMWVAAEESAEQLARLLATDAPLRALTPEQAVQMCDVLRPGRLAGAALDTSAMEINVPALHQAYVRGLIARGGEVRPSAAAVRITPRAHSWEVETPSSTISADAVVNAAGAWVDRVASVAGIDPIGIRPLRRTLFTSPIGGRAGSRAWPFVADIGERFYFHAESDQVLVSPADETPSEPCDARPQEEDIARAIDAVNEFTTLGLRSVRTAWAGLRSFVADRSPVLGSRPTDPGFNWSAGQGGYGIQMGPALARAGAALVLGEPLPADVVQLGVTAASVAPDRAALRPGALPWKGTPEP